MILDNVKVSDARVQSFGFRFDFVTQPDKLIVQATNSKENQKYFGQIPVNPNTNFSLIKEILEEGDFKILTKTEDLLKIQIGTTVIELISTSKSQIKKLKETLQKSLERQSELQNTFQSQNKKMEEDEFMISNLRKTVEQIKSSAKVSVTVLEEMKKQMNDKFNELNENVKNEAQRNQNKLSQNTAIIIKQQNLINKLFNRVSKIQKRVDLIENNAIKIDKFLMTEQKVNEFEFQLDKKLINLKKSILTIEQIILLIEEKKQKQIEEKKKKQIEEKKKKQIEEQKKSQELNEKLSLYYRWSLQLKHDDLMVNQNVVTLNKESDCYYPLGLLQVGFTREVREKQCWGMKIKQFDQSQNCISVGICLKSVVQEKKFHSNITNWGEESNGCYLMNSKGQYWSDLQNKWIQVDESYKLLEGDVIIVEYDPIEWKLTFHNNRYKNKAQMPIPPPPQGDAYHPFVCLDNYDDNPPSVQLIHPVTMNF